jgi:hypothetical protein
MNTFIEQQAMNEIEALCLTQDILVCNYTGQVEVSSLCTS